MATANIASKVERIKWELEMDPQTPLSAAMRPFELGCSRDASFMPIDRPLKLAGCKPATRERTRDVRSHCIA